MKKNCVICGNEFEALGHAKTCGRECSKELCIKHYKYSNKLEYNRERMRKYRKDPKNIERLRKQRREYQKTPKFRELHRKAAIEWLKDPKNRELQNERNVRSRRKKMLSENLLKLSHEIQQIKQQLSDL